MLVLYRTRNPFLSSAWIARPLPAPAEDDDNGRSNADGDVGNVRGRIEDVYRDDPSSVIEGPAVSPQPEERDTIGSGGRGPVVQPSRLQNEGNEWREG